ncbi:hypothetical protein [Streptomyces sp. YGL11-2]|uniref:hypothetical protein n=1 Tax=Streptomyces sp. YGL11-2 TaxID=3414028 RepID=UPI003CEEE409
MPPDWPGFFLVVLGVIGCLIAGSGVYMTLALRRAYDGKKWGDYVVGPVMLVIGIAVAIVGFGLAFHLL